MTRFQRIVTTIGLTILAPIFVCLFIYLVDDKLQREKQDKQDLINDSITKVEIQKSQKWIVDTIYQTGKCYYTFAHNLQYPKLGVKVEDTVKQKYSIHDTINF